MKWLTWEGIESIHTVSATLQCYFLNESLSIITFLNRDRKSSKSDFISHKNFCIFCTSDTKGMSDFIATKKFRLYHAFSMNINRQFAIHTLSSFPVKR